MLLWAASHQLDSIIFNSLCSQFVQFSSVLSVVSVSLQHHWLQHAWLPYPLPTPGAYSCSCPSAWWCHPNISSCLPLLFLPSIFPNVRVFSNESVFPIRWPKYWRLSFNISPSNKYSGLTSFRMDWFDLLAVQGTLKSSPTLQFKSINSSPLNCLYGPTLISITWLLEKPQLWLYGPL